MSKDPAVTQEKIWPYFFQNKSSVVHARDEMFYGLGVVAIC